MAFHIKTFRGLLGDGDLDTLSLHTNNGRIGYRIIKFEVFPQNPGHTANKELLVQIWSVAPATHAAGPGTVVDFNNSDLLAVGYFTENSSGAVVTGPAVVIFENMVFNQDIYVTNQDQDTGQAANYYIELEQFVLNENENTVATLKDIRASATTQ